MNDSDNSDLKLIMPNPVRGYNRSSFLLEKTKKRKRDHSSSMDAQTNVPKLRLFAEKGQLFCTLS